MGVYSTTEEFISKSKKIHDDRYDYSLVEYINAKTKIQIICKEHGIFEQMPYAHLNKQGCPVCRYIKSANKKKLTTEEFIARAKYVHGDRYDYSLVEYVHNKLKVKIICHGHGIFEQIPSCHWAGVGCPKCGGTQKLTTEEFIKKAKSIHDDKYDYSLVKYVNNKTKIKIICNDHGIFEQSANGHSNGQGCPKCGGTQKSSTEDFIRKAKFIHGDRYDYSLVAYVTAKKKVKIICKDHGVFDQRPNDHLSKYGCPSCCWNISKPELELQEYLKSIYDGTINTNIRSIISPYELDIYLPDLKLAIEFNGEYWHSFDRAKQNDKSTKLKCQKKNIKLMLIWERYWVSEKEKMKQAIQNVIKYYEKR